MPTQKKIVAHCSDVADVSKHHLSSPGPVSALNVGKGAQQGQNTAASNATRFHNSDRRAHLA